MRYPASEKLKIIGLVEQSHLPVRRTLEKLGIPRATFYRWYALFRTHGPEALNDHCLPDRLRVPDDAREPINTLTPNESVLSPEAARPLRQQHENQAFNILALFWRRRRIIAGACFAALVIGGLTTFFFMQSQYTADVVIQPGLAHQDPQDPKERGAIVDAASVVETEVGLIQSRATAERVVAALGLSKDPAFAVHESLAARMLSLFMSLWPSSEKSSPPSVESIIVGKLMKNLSVTHDTRSYLIRISYSSTSPGQAAKIANAFADEYVRIRNEATARQELADLVASYGPKHPQILRAQAKLDDALRRSKVGHNAQIVTQAVFLSGRNPPLILGLALLVGLVGGMSIALILERAERGFRTDEELATETNLPCLGMLLETRRALSHPATVDTQTAHAIILAAGVAIPIAGSRLLLVTSSVPDEGKSLLIAGIARTLNDMGLRTLTIDLSPKARKPEIGSNSPALEDVVKATDLGPLPLEVHGSTVLCSAAGPNVVQKLITSPSFSKFLSQAREVYDVVLVEAPAVMLFADAFYLSRFADFVLHVVRWSSTPRRTLAAALERMRNLDIAINGVVLSRVDQQEYRRYTGLAERYYHHNTASTCAVLAQELVPEYRSQQSGHTGPSIAA